MTPEIIYAAYDKGTLLGEHTSMEWEDLLSIPRQTIRDYAREGRTYGKRYKFKVVKKIVLEESEPDQKKSGITTRDLVEFKRSMKIGDKFTVEFEKMIVVRRFPHIVQLASLKDPKRTATVNYAELYKQKKRRKKKKTVGRCAQ